MSKVSEAMFRRKTAEYLRVLATSFEEGRGVELNFNVKSSGLKESDKTDTIAEIDLTVKIKNPSESESAYWFNFANGTS